MAVIVVAGFADPGPEVSDLGYTSPLITVPDVPAVRPQFFSGPNSMYPKRLG